MSPTSDARPFPISATYSSERSTFDIDADGQSDYSSGSSSHSPSLSIGSVSDVGSNTWAPGGVYVPLHRRRRSGSNATSTSASTAPSSVTSSPLPSKATFAPSLPPPPPKPRPGVYARAELLALAPSSLIYASLHPLVTPALLAKHPRILRARGDGVVRALDMARRDSNSASTLHHNNPAQQSSFAHQQSEDVAKVGARVDTHKKKQSSPAAGGLGPGYALPALQINLQATPSAQTQPQPRPTRRRDRGRRRANMTYQRNFAQQASPSPSARSDNNTNNMSANLGPSPSPSPSPIPSPAKYMAPKSLLPTPQNSNRQRRQRLDVTVLSSWRAPQAVAA